MAEIRGRGRKVDQKMKPYLVYDYLMKNSDENHVVSANEICGYLEEMGISAERRSIYKDIEEINKAILLIDAAAEDVYEAEEMCEDEEERTVLYDSHRKGFYVRQRKYDVSDIRFLAESVYIARFIDAKTSKRLIGVLGALVSEHEHKNITHDVFLTDRVKTDNTSVFNNINTITSAMARELDGEKHIPEKIKFKYLYRDIQNYKVYTERGKGAEYVVSPFMLLVSEGCYYLLAFDDAKQKMRTFRVDRMKNVKYTGIPRDGEAEFKKIRLEDYALSHFGMFEGEREHVTMRFASHLLDAVVDRFGTDAVYNKVDSKHFSVTVSVAVSKQFYGWLCGFGNMVKILSPSHIADDYKAHLQKVASLYVMIKTTENMMAKRGGSLYVSTNRFWHAGERISYYTYVVSVVDQIVQRVYIADTWFKLSDGNSAGRWGFFGREAKGEEFDRLIGKRIPEQYRVPGNASPVLYKKYF